MSDHLASEQTVLENSQASKVVYCYAGYNCNPAYGRVPPFSQLIEKDNYDFGATTPTRKTLTTYQRFSGTPGINFDSPCKTMVQDGASNTVAETDYTGAHK